MRYPRIARVLQINKLRCEIKSIDNRQKTPRLNKLFVLAKFENILALVTLHIQLEGPF